MVHNVVGSQTVSLLGKDNPPLEPYPGLIRETPKLAQPQPAVPVRLSEMLRYQAKGFFGFRLDLRSKLSSGPDKSRPDIYPDHGSLPVNRNTLPALRSR